MPDPVSGLADDLGSFGGSGLSNSGEYLVLKSASGEIVDSVDASAGWPAGDLASKQTMQWSADWITATGTPRAMNILSGADSNASSSSAGTIDSGATEVDSVSGGGSNSISAHADQASLSDKKEELKYFASAGRDRLVLVDTPIAFEERLFTSKDEEIASGNVSWSFGDGQSATGKNIVHTYKFPGDYAVVMNVLNNAEIFVARTNVKVVPANLSIIDSSPELVKIRNASLYEANLGGWQLVSGQKSFIFPKDTIILPKKEVTFSSEVMGFSQYGDNVELFSPTKKIVSRFVAPLIPAISSDSTEIPTAAFLLDAERKLSDARKNLAALVASKEQNNIIEPSRSFVAMESVAVSAPESFATNTIQIIEKPKSVLKTLLDLPMNGFRYLRNIFF